MTQPSAAARRAADKIEAAARHRALRGDTPEQWLANSTRIIDDEFRDQVAELVRELLLSAEGGPRDPEQWKQWAIGNHFGMIDRARAALTKYGDNTMTKPLDHFIDLAKSGNQKGHAASSGEFAAARIANALAKSACLLDDLALQGITEFANGAKRSPELAVHIIGMPAEEQP